MALTQVDQGLLNSYAQYTGFKNRIINGAMMIDQRNAGASVTTASNPYTLDRWQAQAGSTSRFTVQQNAGSVTPPAGFSKYLGCTSTGAYTVGASEIFKMCQSIEGYNIADLAWGTASASAVTLSFWVRSSLTGTFGGSLIGTNLFYPFSYTISSANTWEQKSITIAGPTTGTWDSTNGSGIQVNFGLGVGSTYSGTAGSWSSTNYQSATGATSVVGTNGATWYVTGVQLEKGSTATSFDYRPYGTELSLCQRYYQTTFAPGTAPAKGVSANDWWSVGSSASFGNNLYGSERFKVAMRSAPTMYFYNSISSGAADNTVQGYWTSSSGALGVSLDSIATHGFGGAFTGTAVVSNGFVRAHYTANAEL